MQMINTTRAEHVAKCGLRDQDLSRKLMDPDLPEDDIPTYLEHACIHDLQELGTRVGLTNPIIDDAPFGYADLCIYERPFTLSVPVSESKLDSLESGQKFTNVFGLMTTPADIARASMVLQGMDNNLVELTWDMKDPVSGVVRAHSFGPLAENQMEFLKAFTDTVNGHGKQWDTTFGKFLNHCGVLERSEYVDLDDIVEPSDASFILTSMMPSLGEALASIPNDAAEIAL